MKKKVLLAVVVFSLFGATGLFAQEWTSYSPEFQEGDIAIQAGIGLLAGFYGDTTIPPISVSVDYAQPIADLPFSFGGIVAYAKSEDDYSYFGYNWTYEYSYILIGGRAAYHVDFGVDNLDTYAGVLLGFNIVNSSVSGDSWGSSSADSSYMLYGAYAGARYFFTDNIAAFGEVGYGMGLITLGATFKL
ncbi:MAG: hypothetical protein PQJ59_14410 [Spirochaetales bacterium]|nr:hypothetical protein [Spirochaetales bacterium]